MKLLLVVALVALMAVGTNALANHTNNRQDAGERGIDCGWVGADNVPCDCYTDLNRTAVPPTLINANQNATSGELETGIDGDNMRIAIRLDAAFISSNDINSKSLTSKGHLVAGLTAWEPSSRDQYLAPKIWFVNHAQTSDAELTSGNGLNDCPLGASIAEVKGTADYGTLGDACGTTSSWTIKTEGNLRKTLKNCGWKKGTAVPVGQQIFQEYEGKFKVQVDRHGGSLRTAEVILRQEFPFFITIQYPTIVTVTSSNVSVIGAVVEQAALTHQIWDSSVEGGQVDLNAFVGVSYPYALADSEEPGSIGAPLKTLQTKLKLNLTTGEGACAKWRLSTDDACKTTGQTIANYRAGILCDNPTKGAVGSCDIHDFFDLDTAGFGARSSDYDVQQDSNLGPYKALFANGATLFTGGSALPTTSCKAENSGDANLKACKQNLHLRLKPRAGWCDLNVRLELTQGVVCRDDAYGNDTHTATWIPNGNALSTVTGASGRLLTPGGVAILPCSSVAAPDKEVGLVFSLASDDFCPRVIETATLESSLSVYQSENNKAYWGAQISGAPETWGSGLKSSDCAPSGAAPPSATENQLCRQNPGLYTESATAGTGTRQTQTSFVFGTTSYLETRVYAPSGINIDTTTIAELWITKSTVSTFPTIVKDGVQSDALRAEWAKQLVGTAPLTLKSYKNAASTVTVDDTRVKVSNKISGTSNTDTTIDSMISDNRYWFVHSTKANSATLGSPAAKLGRFFEGVSRASVLLDEYTVFISDSDEEAAESVKFWARVTITYKLAADQVTLGRDEITTQAFADSGAASRARLAATPTFTGRSVSAQAGVTPAGSTGTAGGSSTIAGVSATTVVAGTVVVGAVVVAAGVGLFVARRRRTAQRATKRTSSTQELNDTAQVQV